MLALRLQPMQLPALMGDAVGTAFAPIRARESARRLWIGYASHPQGTVVVDDGAARAVQTGKPRY